MSVIHLVRHGRTVLNEARRTQGRCDSPLTPEGRDGAAAVRDYLADVPLRRAYTSPQGRAVETARILLERHRGTPLLTVTGLREYDYGVYDGGPDEQMRQALDPVHHLPAVLSGTHPGAPGGIAATDYLADIDAGLARVLADMRASGRVDEDVLVVSHGMTIMSLAARWLGTRVFSLAPMANCSVTTIEVDPTATDGDPHLLAWALDPAGQGVTFPSLDLDGAFQGVELVPVDLSRPGPVEQALGPQGPARS
ncbi:MULTISPECIES: histidine phosphatase family protein [unclassified Actinomyces]|uniref:histidine phosphatase family protein n=1 Tax=unclassified Actinomyces TaxID=2609248 RepID=UPI00201827DC|nr:MULTISPECIES: histidine phosphatase family protein [unclassified Actinomyces]MCL3777953.1 histidine phosphatase family protein [Actinomyces sp. AC-20-1]MCL3790904.1 histidine phosphatase family protein [Actinomyces sp. 187325]MCL3791169.1 histidine phosphatase family protein [Actinomyces sp. 186855]MCL3793730.1 histidine phosphatase family protein [Actinomyces sp. 217892]